MVRTNLSKKILSTTLIYFDFSSRLFPEDESIDMMPVLKKSKEMAKQLREKGITPNIRRSSNPPFSSRSNGTSSRRGGFSNHMLDRGHPSMRGRRTVFKGNLNRIKSKPIGRKPMFSRMIPKGHPMHRFGGSTTAAAEAYVADYMRTMQYQLPPMPMNPPASFPTSLPPALPRYYDGVPAIPDYPPPPIRNQPPIASSSSSSNYDKRSYDEFMWKNKNRNANGGLNNANNRDRSRDTRDSYRSGGDKHRNYRR